MASLWDTLLNPGGTHYFVVHPKAPCPPHPTPYPAGPFGDNGTQQFVRRSDKEIWEMVFPSIQKQFWREVYLGDPGQAALTMIMNMREISTKAVDILRQVQAKIGYPPKETVRAMKCHIWQTLKTGDDPAYQMLLIIFQVSEICIEVDPHNQTGQKSQPKVPKPQPTAPYYNEVKPQHDVLDRLDQLDREISALKEALLSLLHH